jgi:hypothetical protein
MFNNTKFPREGDVPISIAHLLTTTLPFASALIIRAPVGTHLQRLKHTISNAKYLTTLTGSVKAMRKYKTIFYVNIFSLNYKQA